MIETNTLTELVGMQRVGLIKFAGAVWIIDASGALYCPAKDTLFVADLHFEKGSYLSQYASPLPRYDSRATLTVLAELIDRYHPTSMVCLGDSFHDSGAYTRLSNEDLNLLRTLIARVADWTWVVGNHDPFIPDSLPGNVLMQWQACVGNTTVIGCHQPNLEELHSTHQIIGHFHPKTELALQQRVVRGKCLIITPSLIVMPALGRYTGGLAVNDPALLSLASAAERQCWLLYRDRVYACP